MNPIEKELVKAGEKKINESMSLVNDVKMLLADNASEERELLKQIGLDRDIRFIESRKEDILTRQKQSEFFGKPIVHFSEIKKICEMYRMDMRHASSFSGVLPNDLPAELLRLTREKKIPIAAHHDHNNFMVIAPPKMFNGYQTLGEIYAEGARIQREEKERARLARENDPILLYKLDNDYYAVIRSWGNDFSWMRRLYAICTTRFMLQVFNFLHKVVLFAILATVSFHCWDWFANNIPAKGPQGWWIVGFCVGAAVNLIAAVWLGFYFWEETIGNTREYVIRKLSSRTINRKA